MGDEVARGLALSKLCFVFYLSPPEIVIPHISSSFGYAGYMKAAIT